MTQNDNKTTTNKGKSITKGKHKRQHDVIGEITHNEATTPRDRNEQDRTRIQSNFATDFGTLQYANLTAGDATTYDSSHSNESREDTPLTELETEENEEVDMQLINRSDWVNPIEIVPNKSHPQMPNLQDESPRKIAVRVSIRI